jgi:hypothetical protein
MRADRAYTSGSKRRFASDCGRFQQVLLKTKPGPAGIVFGDAGFFVAS